MSGWNLTGSILIINLKCTEHEGGGGPGSPSSCPGLSAGTSLLTPHTSHLPSQLEPFCCPSPGFCLPLPRPSSSLAVHHSFFISLCSRAQILLFLLDGRMPTEGRSWSDVTVYVSRTFRFSDWGFSFIACPPSEEVAFERYGFAYWVPSVYPFYLK